MNIQGADSPAPVVTGGSRGIGVAVVRALARQGWDVCSSYLRDDQASQATAEHVPQLGRRAVMVQADVADRKDLRRRFAVADQAFGRLDALINNAGIVGQPRSILDADDAHVTALLRTSVSSQFSCVHEAVQRMSTRRGGQELVDRVGPSVPIGRSGTADEVVEVVAFLAGPLSSYMHGAIVDVSGGR